MAARLCCGVRRRKDILELAATGGKSMNGDDPYWPRASAWLAGEFEASPSGGLAVIGAPLRLGSITPGRCDLAPAAVRSILRKFSCYDIESDVDLRRLA